MLEHEKKGSPEVSDAAAILHQPALLEASTRGDREAFQRLAEPYRRELQLHCYRMLGSLQDAEDLVQETFLRAWRGLAGFKGDASFRSWLYRIATNVCLTALAKRASARRALPETQAPPAASDQMPEGAPATEIAWLEPYPDAALEGIADDAPGPDARYELHEAVQLAFVAAIQLLPPRQRAVLLLRDVLGWSATETAGLLDTSVASANSALQRARATLGKRFPTGQPTSLSTSLPAPDDQQRALLDRYVRTWEDADLDGLVALLREDAVLSMPPWPQWYRGRAAIRAFFGWALGSAACGSLRSPRSYRLVLTAANRQPAFAVYCRVADEVAESAGSEWRAHAIQLVTLQGDAIAALTTFRDPQLFAAFGFPATLSPRSDDEAAPPTAWAVQTRAGGQ